MSSDSSTSVPCLSVIVVTICGIEYLNRCMKALHNQDTDVNFEIIVAYDQTLENIPAIEKSYPDVKLYTVNDMRTPEELASLGIHNSKGNILALTEDHCIPDTSWCRQLLEIHDSPNAAVGGTIECLSQSIINWAFAFSDYYRYLNPVPEGITPYLTVCNVSYKRHALEKIVKTWESYFHETYVNEALRSINEKLWLTPALVVEQERNIRFLAGVHERYSFGRLFGSRRTAAVSPTRRLFYAVASPAIPVLLLGRMLKNVVLRRRRFFVFLKATPFLTIFTLAWAWGEFLGYLIGRGPKELYVVR